MSIESNASFDRSAEVERLLDEDDSMLGRVWRYRKQGYTPQQMTEAENFASTGWVSISDQQILALREGKLPIAPTIARGTASKFRAWLKDKELVLSDELREALTKDEQILSSRAEDKIAQAEEVVAAVKATEFAEARGTAGIYVYTLPHYLRHPIDTASGKTLLRKV